MKKVRIGSVGLGRLGAEHARNLAFLVPNAELCAICDIDANRVADMAKELNVPKQYTDYKAMCEDPDLDAIVIVSPSMFHSEQIKIALEAGKHVFCEKPLETTVDRCKDAEKIVEAHPDKVFMLGFMRRFDPSYQIAKKKIDNGDIGRVILVRCCSQNPRAIIENTLKFAPHSGGQFLDMCVHDIDLVRWLTKEEPKQVWGIGGCYEFPQYADWNDGDNVGCMMKCDNDAMAFMFAGRTAAHGDVVETEIIGTHGTLRVGAIGTDSMVEVMSEHGVCRECYQDFITRWHDAYVAELVEFCNCVIDNRKPEVTVYDGTAVSNIAYRCKESFETGKMLEVE